MKIGRLPAFLIIGAPKCGTTALWKALDSHPDIFMSRIKEPGYLAYGDKLPTFRCPGSEDVLAHLVCDFSEYKNLFAECPTHRKAGEATPFYLAHPDAPTRAAKLVPKAKLVAVLRNPVERAFSHWVYYRMKGIEMCDSFEEAMSMEPERLQKGWRPGWGYKHQGLYGQHLEHWKRFFPEENLLIVFYEDWVQNPISALNKICNHIGVSGAGMIKVPMENRSFAPRSARFQQIVMGHNLPRRLARRFLPVWARDALMWPMLRLNLGPKPRLDPSLRKKLTAVFDRDICRVEALTGRNLHSWRT